jgi:hypothetical protein
VNALVQKGAGITDALKSDSYSTENYMKSRLQIRFIVLHLKRKRKFRVAEAELDDGNEIWRRFLRKHWTAVAVFVAAAVLASIGAVLVYLWVVGNAQSTGLVPSILTQWAMAHIVTFLLRLILWEILFIGIPVIVAALVGWLWWRRLPSEGRKENRVFGIRSRATSGGEDQYRCLFLSPSASKYSLMENGMLLSHRGHLTISCILCFGQ